MSEEHSMLEEFEQAGEDLQMLLLEVLGSLLDVDEVAPSWQESMITGPAMVSRLAIHETEDDSYMLVEIQAGTQVVRLIAGAMLRVVQLSPEDLLDVVAELGNILAGNVKSLIRNSCRLSLPMASAVDQVDPKPGQEVRIGASVLGEPVHLVVRPARPEELEHIAWPGVEDASGATEHDEMMEATR